MSDIRIVWSSAEGEIKADFAIEAADLALDDTLETAVIVSLYTDRRAPDDYLLPDDIDDRRGWWADDYAPVPDDEYGSHLWLLAFEKWSEPARQKAETWAREALKWLLDDGIATSVEVVATLPRWMMLGLRVEIIEAAGSRRICTINAPWPGAGG